MSNMEIAFDGVNILNGLYRSGALHIYRCTVTINVIEHLIENNHESIDLCI